MVVPGYIRPLDKVSGDILLGALNCTRLLVPHLLSNSHPQLISGDNLHQGVLAMVSMQYARMTGWQNIVYCLMSSMPRSRYFVNKSPIMLMFIVNFTFKVRCMLTFSYLFLYLYSLPLLFCLRLCLILHYDCVQLYFLFLYLMRFTITVVFTFTFSLMFNLCLSLSYILPS